MIVMMTEGYIDIHIHILPDVDDGAANMRMALNMLKMEHDEGVRAIICTPHYGELGKVVRPKQFVDAQFTKLKLFAAEQYPDMQLYRGNELFCQRDMPMWIREGRACTLNGTQYALIEFDPLERGRDIYDDLLYIKAQGFIPVLAHAERHFGLVENPKLIDRMVSDGILIQVNAFSLMLERTRPFKKLARQMFEHQQIHFVATDAHGDDLRVPYLMPAIKWMYKSGDASYVDAITKFNAEKLIAGASI